MKKIVLIHPVVREWAAPCNLPLGIAYIAACLRRAGVQYDVLDDNMLRWPDEKIHMHFAVNQYEFAGISAICHQYRQVKRWVELLREVAPETKIIIGGPISQLGAKLIKWLAHPFPEMSLSVWQGEGEALPERLDDPEGSWKSSLIEADPIEDLNALPFPSWQDFNMIEYAENPVGWLNKNKWHDGKPENELVPRSMNLLAARGCPYTCKFCSHDFMGTSFRVRSAENILKEMQELWERYSIRYFHLSDDSTMSRPTWLRKFCLAVATHPVLRGCHWGCAGRVDAASEEMLKLMYASGCRIIGFGVESGSQAMLDVLDKRTKVEEAVRAVRRARGLFGSASYSMIVGTPGENDETIQASIDFCHATETRPEVVFYLTPLPGAYFYDYALQRKLIPDEEKYMLELGENSKKISCNISGQPDDWLRDAKARLEDETKQYGAAI